MSTSRRNEYPLCNNYKSCTICTTHRFAQCSPMCQKCWLKFIWAVCTHITLA